MKRLILILAILLIPCSNAFAQERAADEYYGQGVTHYFNGNQSEALNSLNRAISANMADARYYYFRGLAQAMNGNSSAGDSDFRQAAMLEYSTGTGARSVNVSRALEKVQGCMRHKIESFRRQARTPGSASVGFSSGAVTTSYSAPVVSAPIMSSPIMSSPMISSPVMSSPIIQDQGYAYPEMNVTPGAPYEQNISSGTIEYSNSMPMQLEWSSEAPAYGGPIANPLGSGEVIISEEVISSSAGAAPTESFDNSVVVPQEPMEAAEEVVPTAPANAVTPDAFATEAEITEPEPAKAEVMQPEASTPFGNAAEPQDAPEPEAEESSPSPFGAESTPAPAAEESSPFGGESTPEPAEESSSPFGNDAAETPEPAADESSDESSPFESEASDTPEPEVEESSPFEDDTPVPDTESEVADDPFK